MKVRQNRFGFTLLEVIISLGIGGIVILVIASYIYNVGKVSGKEIVKLDQQKIATNIEKRLSELENLFRPAQFLSSANTSLVNCLDAASSGNCTVTDSNAQAEFELFDNSGQRMAGTSGNPVYYSRTGAPNCTIGTPGCPFFQAFAYFWGRCANGTVCSRANTIYFRYQVVPLVPNYQGLTLTAIPDPIKFNATPKTAFAVSHKLSRALEWGQVCPVGSEQIGFESGGKLKCQCRFNAPQIGVNAEGQPICDVHDYVCPADTIMQGSNAIGLPICRVVAKQCDPNYQLADENAQCPNGGWMTGLNLGVCTAGTAAKKGYSRPVNCALNKAHCCWLQPQPSTLPPVPQ